MADTPRHLPRITSPDHQYAARPDGYSFRCDLEQPIDLPSIASRLIFTTPSGNRNLGNTTIASARR